jgi:hypothetical protein
MKTGIAIDADVDDFVMARILDPLQILAVTQRNAHV